MKSHSEKFAKMGRYLRIKATKVVGFMVAAFAIGVISIGPTVNAWGPTRTTYKWPHGSTSIQLNSMTGNKAWGDERAFTVVRDLGTVESFMDVLGEEGDAEDKLRKLAQDGNGFAEKVKAQAGHYYMVKMFVHNNAQEQLNLIAKNTRVWSTMVTAPTDDEILIQGAVSADNCGATKTSEGKPCVVWDEAALTGTKGTYLKASYAGYPRYYNETNKNGAGFKLDENSIVGDITDQQIQGAKIGYQKMDGNLPGCSNYAGFATFVIKVDSAAKPDFEIEKKVRFEGQGDNDWKDSITAKPGQKVEYLIEYTNTSDKSQNNPIIADILPTGVKYTKGNSKVFPATHPDGVALPETYKTPYPLWLLQSSFDKDTGAKIIIKATLPNEEELICGSNTLSNYAIGFVKGSGSLTDRADVLIERTKGCQPPEDACRYDSSLKADDPKCVAPPNTGSIIPPTAKFGAILGLIFAAVLVTRYHLAKKHNQKSDK